MSLELVSDSFASSVANVNEDFQIRKEKAFSFTNSSQKSDLPGPL